jgi:hypothetical protein
VIRTLLMIAAAVVVFMLAITMLPYFAQWSA